MILSSQLRVLPVEGEVRLEYSAYCVVQQNDLAVRNAAMFRRRFSLDAWGGPHLADAANATHTTIACSLVSNNLQSSEIDGESTICVAMSGKVRNPD